MSYAYIASPYTHHDPKVMEGRYRAVCLYTAQLLANDIINARTVFSPIVHCHALAKVHDLPRDIVFWRDYNIAMLEQAGKLAILQLPNWKESTGVNFEWGLAVGLKLSIVFVDPEDDILAELYSGTNT